MIVFVHLLNDASGSPRVLQSAIAALTAAGYSAKLYIGSDGDGCLSHCDIPITRYWYKRTGNRVFTLFTYMASQLVLLFKLLTDRSIDRNAVVYVNTLLPFCAALYGRLTRHRVIYHVHEVSITPAPLLWLLTGIARLTSCMNIYVSDAHAKARPIKGVPFIRLYNSLNDEFTTRAHATSYNHRRNGVFKVLMPASLRDYKGIPEFLALSQHFCTVPDMHFDLVVNDQEEAIQRYFAGKSVPHNLTIHAKVADTSRFYGAASLVVNLSRVDAWVETFGMTILEALSYGLPVIVPALGGPVELAVDGEHGYHVDSRDHERLYSTVLALYQNPALCKKISVACRVRSTDFSEARFREGLVNLMYDLGCKTNE